MDALKALIRDVPDFPKPGILFKDITPALLSPQVFRAINDGLAAPWQGKGIQKVLGIEARGFIFGAPLAERLGAGFVPVRKAGKLPHHTHRESYALEYGEATLELHRDALHKGERVLIVDDLLATGGTARAASQLVRRIEAEVAGFAFVVELAFLKGRTALAPTPIHSLVVYP